jgi:hypothetical protein
LTGCGRIVKTPPEQRFPKTAFPLAQSRRITRKLYRDGRPGQAQKQIGLDGGVAAEKRKPAEVTITRRYSLRATVRPRLDGSTSARRSTFLSGRGQMTPLRVFEQRAAAGRPR